MERPTTSPDPSRRDVLLRTPELIGLFWAMIALAPEPKPIVPQALNRASSPVDFNLSPLAPGDEQTVMVDDFPIFIRRMTPDAMAAARAASMDDLKDPNARNANLPDAPASLANRLIDRSSDILVMNGLCTHLGCYPLKDTGDFGGWFCPCHGSHYDTAGRIRKGPAPQNLSIPPITFLGESTIRIG